MKLECGCGNIEVTWDTQLSPIMARQCSCDYCTRHGCHYVSDPNSTVSYKVFNQSLLKIVKHGTETATFIECVNCGLVLVTSQIDDALYSVLNAKVLALKPYSLDPKIKVFSNESIREKLSRRKQNWCKTEVHG